MKFNNRFVAGVSWLALAAFVAPVSAVHAQTTASELRGSVTDAEGAPVEGASITITHLPTATVSATVTNAQGQFFSSGLRVGGPFRVTVSAPGFEGEVLDDLSLRPGANTPLRIRLDPAVTDRILVVGQAISTVDLNNGVGSAFRAEDVANQPAISRDVIRTLLRDPLAQSDGVGNLSVAGVNPRFNGLAIDGSLQQDDFGLGSNTYATERSPINIDAIEAVSLAATDYSVTVSGFTGGLVNIVTKSGTNEFDGAAFYYYADPDFVGDEAFDREFNPGDFDEKEYGISLGGPIIKDRLFFFVSYDEFESSSATDYAAGDANQGLQPGFFAALNDIVEQTYGFDMGGRPSTANNPITSERLLAKIDWNINENHRASFTYQDTEETGTSASRTNFTSAWYDIPVELTAYSGALYSDWTPNLSTTLRANYKEFVRGQICRAGDGVGQLEFVLSEADLVGTPLAGLIDDGDGTVDTSENTFIGGCDRFRHANEFDDNRLQLFGSADYTIGNHLITVGAEYEQFELFNLFVDTSEGRYVFTSVDNVLNGVANVSYRNVPSNDVSEGAAEWGYERLTLFAQDTWSILPTLDVSAGVRYERFLGSDDTPSDAGVTADYGFNPSRDLEGLDLVMPRVSFRWTPLERTTVTGGFGLFAGGEPKVWLSNAFQPGTVFVSANGVTGVDPFNPPAALVDEVAQGTTRIIDIISPDFEIPSDWKASLRVEQEFGLERFGLGDGYLATAGVLYTKANESFLWENIAQTELAGVSATGVAPDGRTIYADLNALGVPNLTMLRNGSEAESVVFSASLAKDYENGFDFYLGYAFQDVEAVSEGTSSRGISSWRGITAIDRNDPEARTSPFQVEHTFRLAFGYEKAFIRDLMTRVDVFGNITSGEPFTYTFDVNNSNALFGRAFGSREGPFDNNPLYIPTPGSDPRVVYASGFDVDGFFDYVNERGIPTGEIHTVNSDFSTWNQVWDVRFQQDLPGLPFADRFVGDNRFKLVLDVENFLNLLNDEWGTVYNGPGNSQLGIVQADLVSAADVAANGVDGATALTGDAPRTTCLSAGDCVYRFRDFDADPSSFESTSRSVWRARIGIRYEF